MLKYLVLIFFSISLLFGQENNDFITKDPLYDTGCKQIIENRGKIPETMEAMLTYYYIKGVVSTFPIIYKDYKLEKSIKVSEVCAFSVNSDNPLVISIIYLMGKVNGLSDEEIYEVIFGKEKNR